ncbi:MAG: integrase arm-type DNA-binding domain-containing protein [Bdellovibrionales bacterium]
MSKITVPLTEKKCQSAKHTEGGKNRLFDGGGLYLELMPTGSKIWRHKFTRPNGAENRLTYGPYPEIGILEARKKREVTRELLREGKDPAVLRELGRSKSTQSANDTFERIAREWYDLNKPKWVARHSQNILARLEKDIFTEIGQLPVSDISHPIMLATIRKIETRGAFDIARRTLQLSRQVFDYAIITQRAQINPCIALNKVLKPYKKGHFPSIAPKEIPQFLAALNGPDARLHKLTRLATNLLMLTFVRTGELIKSTWDEYDFEKAQWVIASERMKMGRDHIVPLSRQAMDILHEIKKLVGNSPYVLPSIAKPKKHMSECTILNAIKRIGYKGHMTGHGFRSLAMTTLKEEVGYSHEIVDRQLAHAPGDKLGRAYDRTEYLKERRKMMQDWADYLDKVGGKKSAN